MLKFNSFILEKVKQDVKNILKIQNCVTYKTSFNRSNLFYEIKRKSSSSKDITEEIFKFITSKYPNESGIIYCFSRKVYTFQYFLTRNEGS